MAPYTAEATGPNVLTVRMTVDTQTDWERWFLLHSDEHWDNPHCDRKLLTKHHEQAKERRAGIIKIGDTFDAMGGKWDKRSDKSNLRPEHQHGDYLDSLVRTGADFYEPFAPLILLMGDGNHETAVRKAHETDLIERLCATLNDRTGSRIHHGGYSGWVRFMFTRGSQRLSRRLWYTHGYGGGGPVTQDMIQGNRQQVFVENADIMASGHTHDCWAMERPKLRLNDAGTIEHRSLWQLKCATYKDAYGDGRGGFEVEKGHPPKPLGGWWLRFSWEGDGIHTQVLRAD